MNIPNNLMRTITIIITILYSIGGYSQTSTADVTTNASAGILIAMTISENSSMSFGSNLLTNNLGGTIVLPSNSTTRVYTNGVAESSISEPVTNASFDVTGTAYETYTLVVPETTTVTHTSATNGVNTMDITLMTARFEGEIEDTIISSLSEDGTDSFTMGGTLTVEPNQISGQYEGSYSLSVDYN